MLITRPQMAKEAQGRPLEAYIVVAMRVMARRNDHSLIVGLLVVRVLMRMQVRIRISVNPRPKGDAMKPRKRSTDGLHEHGSQLGRTSFIEFSRSFGFAE